MRKPRSFYLGETGRDNVYHVVTRTAGREILFGAREKEMFRRILFRQLKFSGLRALAWCLMGNHLHLLLEVPDREAALQNLTEDDLLARLEVLKGEYSARQLLSQVQLFRAAGNTAGVAGVTSKVRARIFDLSAFMKELKMKLTSAYNRAHGRQGTLWEGRFKCTLVEGAEATRTVAAYIDLNPVRAGLTRDPESYRWCSYAAAVAGVSGARSNLARAVTGRTGLRWGEVAAEYRVLLYGKGEARLGGPTPDGSKPGRRGFSAGEVESVLSRGGLLSLAAALRCRVRYFSDGAVLGSENSVIAFFERQRGYFGSRRRSGARRMRGADWGTIRTLRDLRVEPLTFSGLKD